MAKRARGCGASGRAGNAIPTPANPHMKSPRTTLRALFWLLLVVAPAVGCVNNHRVEQIQQGMESVDDHSREIEEAAEYGR
jgi:hypothetical protein